MSNILFDNGMEPVVENSLPHLQRYEELRYIIADMTDEEFSLACRILDYKLRETHQGPFEVPCHPML